MCNNKHLYLHHEKHLPWVVYIRLYIHFYSLTPASCMSNSPFKNHRFLQSQALHNGLFQDLHSAYICMKKLQGKKSSSAYLSFGHLIKKVTGFILTISMQSLESNHNCFSMWQMNNLCHGLTENKPMFCPGTTRATVPFCLHMQGISDVLQQCLLSFLSHSISRGLFIFFHRRPGGHQPGKDVRY